MGGDTDNIIPDTATLGGSLRTDSKEKHTKTDTIELRIPLSDITSTVNKNYQPTAGEDFISTADKKDYFDNSSLKEQYDQSFLLEYIANRTIGSEEGGMTEKKIVNEMLARVIENILETDVDMDEDKLENLFKKQISIIKTRNKEKRANVDKTLVDRFNKEKSYREEVINLLKAGVEVHEEN